MLAGFLAATQKKPKASQPKSAEPERSDRLREERLKPQPLTVLKGSQPMVSFETRTNSLSEHLKPLIENPSKVPSPNLFLNLTLADKSSIVNLYKSGRELTNLVALTWALTAFRDDETAQLFVDTLTSTFGGKVLSTEERKVMRDTVWALGFVASDSDLAFRFATNAVSPEFWRVRRNWTVDERTLESDQNRAFSGLAVQAMGLSGRTEVPQILDQLTNSEFGKAISGAIVDAFFKHDFIKEKSLDAYRREILKDGSAEAYDHWAQTPRGGQFVEWYLQAQRTSTEEPKKNL